MQEKEQQLTFKSLFLPFTTKKAMIFIVIIGLAIFFNMLFNGFVWDDKIYIVFYTDIHSFNFFAFLKENLFNGGGQYRPIPTMYFSLLYIIFKNSTFFYHILQLTLHITNALLLFLVFSKFVEKKLAFFLSLIFLVHPMQVESVSYIAATGNPLFFLFGITAFLLSMNNLNWKKLCIISALLLFSLLTKEAGVIFLFIVFLYRFLFKRKQIIPLFLAESVSLLLYSLIRFGIGGVFFSTLPLVPIARLSLVQRLINIPVIIFYYLKTFLFPVDLAIDQQWTINKVNFSNFYLPLIVDLLFVILVTILGTYIYKKYKDEIKIYLFFVAWFIFGMLLYLQIFPLDGTVADRWFYFPIVGLLGILGIGIHLIKSNHKIIKKISYLLIIFLVILFSIRTITRNTNW